MTNDGKLEWRLPAARSPCQQRIRGKEASEKMTVKNTHTNTNRDTQTGRRRGQVLTKASELHRVRWGITGEQFKRDTSLRALITMIPLDWLNGVFFNSFFFFFLLSKPLPTLSAQNESLVNPPHSWYICKSQESRHKRADMFSTHSPQPQSISLRSKRC